MVRNGIEAVPIFPVLASRVMVLGVVTLAAEPATAYRLLATLITTSPPATIDPTVKSISEPRKT